MAEVPRAPGQVEPADVHETSQPESNEDAERLARVAQALIDGDPELAASELEPIAGQTTESRPVPPKTFSAAAPTDRPVSGSATTSVTEVFAASLFVHDCFTCRYCGRETIPPPVLRLISARFPDAFAYHRNWKRDVCHRAYWDISTAFVRLGAPTGNEESELENFATACARCRYQKGTLPSIREGWQPQPPHLHWDGLTKSARALRDAVGQPPGNFEPWFRAFDAAWDPEAGITTRSRLSGPPRHYDVSMADLIDAGLIPPEGTLTSHYRGGGHVARYTRETVTHNGVGHRSPSMAGQSALGGRNVNGWDFWFVDRDGQKVALTDVRAQYLAERDAR